jgi:histone deacetylase 1/2
MHKGYKCLDRRTGRIYISRDVIFDETVFPFATPGVTIDVSQLHPVAFPLHEPAIQNTNTRTMLPIDPPDLSSVVFVQDVQAPISLMLLRSSCMARLMCIFF